MAPLKKVDVDPDYIRSSAKHIDMILIVWELCTTSPFSSIQEHVYGHQDASKEPLSIIANLNNKMDSMVTRPTHQTSI